MSAFLRRAPGPLRGMIGLALLPAMACAQSSMKPLAPYVSAQNALPSEGPAAARLNPARLAEVNLAALAYGRFGTLSGKAGTQFAQAAVGTPWGFLPWPVALAAGLGYLDQETTIDGSNMVYQTAEYDPGFAVRFPADPEAPFRLEAGLALAIGAYDAFGVYRSITLGIEAGALTSLRTRAGRFGLGFAYHDLKSPRISLPDGDGYFKIPGWMEPSLEWVSAADRVHTHLSFFINEPADPREGASNEAAAGINGWDLEYRPAPWLGLKAERVRAGSRSTLGLVWRPVPPVEPVRAFLELDWGHDKFGPARLLPFLFGDPGEDEGRGYQLSLSLGAEI